MDKMPFAASVLIFLINEISDTKLVC